MSLNTTSVSHLSAWPN